jgi:predicted ester cyclase
VARRALLLNGHRAAQTQGENSMSQANKAVVRRLIEEVMNGVRLDVLDQLYTPATAAAARTWIAPFRAAFPEHMRVVDLAAEDDKVAARFTCSATQRGGRQGHPATGQRFERVHEVYFLRFRDGRIASAWGLEDNLSRMQQLGFGPAVTGG